MVRGGGKRLSMQDVTGLLRAGLEKRVRLHQRQAGTAHILANESQGGVRLAGIKMQGGAQL